MFFVIYLDDDGKLHVKNAGFTLRKSAEKYAESIARRRNPVVVEGAAMPVCDNPNCWNFAGMVCAVDEEERERMGAECLNSSYYTDT